MGLAPFFDRIAAATEGALSVSRESLEHVLRDVTVTVILGPGLDDDPNSKWAAELVVNLAARLYPKLHLVGTPADVGFFRRVASSINPSIEFASAAGSPKWTLCVGDVEVPSEALHVDADGWVAVVSAGAPARVRGPANPYSAGAAACLAMAELFRRVFALATMQRGEVYRLSLVDYGEALGADWQLGTTILQDVAFVGLGAVGQAALWALGRDSGVSGECWLVDDEKLEVSNLQRYVGGFYADVGTLKTNLAERLLKASAISRRRRAVALGTFAGEFGGEFRVPTICVSVDNIGARRAVQALLPRLIVNAYTGGGSLGVSWHEFDRDAACLACLYQPRGESLSLADQIAQSLGLSPQRAAILVASQSALTEEELTVAGQRLMIEADNLNLWRGRPVAELYVHVVCGGATLPIPGRGRSEVVPLAHQSALAGVLLAAELTKRSRSELAASAQTVPLVAWHDVRRRPPRRWLEPRARSPGCICGDRIYQEVFAEKWKP